MKTFENTEIFKVEKETEFEQTPMHHNGQHLFIRRIELIQKEKVIRDKKKLKYMEKCQ